MFFVSVGSINYEFTRLLNALETLSYKDRCKVIYQGYINKSHEISSFKILTYIPRKSYLEYIEQSEIVITHCGIGTIYECAHLSKKTIIVPRLLKYSEHNNDHQLEIFNELSERPIPNIYPLLDLKNLEETINFVLNQKISTSPVPSGLGNLKNEIQINTNKFLML